MTTEPASSADLAAGTECKYKVGTLAYTKAGLVALFCWLLWGDFCYQLHEEVIRTVLPLAFRRHGAPNFLLGLLMTSTPALLHFTLNPIISTASDRTRTRWGRRIPYLALGAPVNAVFLILLAFSEQIGLGTHRELLARLVTWSPAATVVGVMAASFAIWRITDMFVATTFWYLFNDVVPHEFMARFIALFRIVGLAASAGFNFFFFRYAETNMREIFLCVAVIYMVGYTLMCFRVKEGKYPPPPAGMERRKGLVGMAKMFFKECFFHRFYWYFFLANATWALSGACGVFVIFFTRDSLGLSLNQIGRFNACTQVASAVLLYPAAMLCDKIHPLRYTRITITLQFIWAFTGLSWLFWNPTPSQGLAVLIGLAVVSVPLSAAHNAANYPLIMRLMPKERFGQFCSANAMTGGLIMAVSGVAAGGYMDVMKWVYHGDAFAYRYLYVWVVAGYGLSTVLTFMLYREWNRLGGLASYAPPRPDDVPAAAPSPTSEEASQTP